MRKMFSMIPWMSKDSSVRDGLSGEEKEAELPSAIMTTLLTTLE